MGVLRDDKPSSKPLDPIFGLSQEVQLFLMFFLFRRAFLGRHVPAVFRRRGLFKNRWVITAMEINVCLRKKLIRKETPAVSKQDFQHASRLPTFAPIGDAPLKRRGQSE